MSDKEDKPIPVMTVKKYKLFKQFIETTYGSEHSDKICQKLCDIFKFDPVIGNSSQKRTQRVLEWRERKAKELGVTPNDIRKGLKKLLITRNEDGGKPT